MVAAATEQIVSIPVGAIRPKNIRQTFNDAELEEMASTIRLHGIIEPLVVRDAVDGVHELVAGERRWRAAQLAGLAEVPAVVREYSDRQAREVQIIENVQRKGLDAVEEGTGYRELIDDHGYTADMIAAAIGKKKRYVYQRMALAASLIPAAREALARHEVTANHTILLSRLPGAEMQAVALQATIKRQMPVKDLDRYIKEQLLRKLQHAAFDRSDAGLVAGAGSCEECPKNSANAPELYPDLKMACCVDRACYELKLQAHVDREIRESNGDLVQVVRGHHWFDGSKPKHVRERHEYSLIEKKSDRCGDQVEGIVTYGAGVGEKVQVCISPRCKKHGARVSGRPERRPEKELAKERKERLELDTARAVRGRIVDAMVAAAPVETTIALLEDLVEAWWEDFGSEEKRLLRKRHPDWDAETIPVGDLDEPALIKMLVEFSLWRWLFVSSWHKDKSLSKDQQARAEAAGVDWSAIETAVRAEWKDGKPKAPKAGTRLAEVFAGHETDNGKLIEFRAKAKGPVLASIELTKVTAKKKRLVEKYAGAEPEDLGWRVFVGVNLPKCKAGHDVADNSGTAWMNTTTALRAAFACVGLLITSASGPDGELVRAWADRKLAALGGPLDGGVTVGVDVVELEGGDEWTPPDVPVAVIECKRGKKSLAGIEFRVRPEGYFVAVYVSLPEYGLSGPLHLDGEVRFGEEIWLDQESARVAALAWMSRFLGTVESYAGATKATRSAAKVVLAWIEEQGALGEALPAMATCAKCGVWMPAGAVASHEAACEGPGA